MAQSLARFRLPRRAHWIVAAALLAGLLLFLAIWTSDRQRGFYSVDPNAPGTAEGQVDVFEPLPTPLPADGRDTAFPVPPAGIESRPAAAIESPARPAPPSSRPATPPPAVTPATSRAAYVAPVPVSQPPPRYPPAALRQGASGRVEVQVDVGPDGVPTSVSVANGSGNRELDRAALDAVRRWRFKPATADGQPAVGRVTVPIQFTLGDAR